MRERHRLHICVGAGKAYGQEVEHPAGLEKSHRNRKTSLGERLVSGCERQLRKNFPDGFSAYSNDILHAGQEKLKTTEKFHPVRPSACNEKEPEAGGFDDDRDFRP